MRRAALLPFDVTKEIRGLAGAWLACLTALVIPAAMGVRATRALEIPAYFLGVAALGALSIGHEYSHSTLTLLLSQPRSRARLFLVKQGVLAAMLLTLAAVAGAVVDLRARESATLAFARAARALRPVRGAVAHDAVPQPARGDSVRRRVARRCCSP